MLVKALPIQSSVDVEPRAYHANKALIARVTSIALGCLAVISAGLLIAAAVGASIGSCGLVPATALIATAVAGGVLSGYFHQVSNWASRLENDPAFKSFEAYVEGKCEGVSFKDANNWASEGKAIIEQLGCENFGIYATTVDEESKDAMLCKVSWYFMKLAIETGQGFEHGTIKFVDPKHCIAKFFEPIMYNRISSHFNRVKDSSMGFDPQNRLPHEFKHVHMGRLTPSEDPTTPHFSFIKLEIAGTKGITNFLVHTVSFVYAKFLAKIAFEASGPSDRKEHTLSWDVKQARENFLKTLAEPDQKVFKKLETPWEMYQFATAHPAPAALQFRKAIESIYPKTMGLLPYAGVGAVCFNPFAPADAQSLPA